MSLLPTSLSPVPKSPTERRVPEVSSFVVDALIATKHPETVPLVVMANACAAVVAFDPFAAPEKEGVFRLPV